MSNTSPSPGSSGVVGLVLGVIAASAGITLATGDVVHWPIVAGGVLVGLWTLKAIGKH
jgi:hypothetical protein